MPSCGCSASSRLTGDNHPDTLVYLALPPGLLTSVLPALATSNLGDSDAVAIEKPFGTDLESARHLNEILHRVIVLRFLNRVFEPILNAVHVERVEVSWLETLTLEGRASYYDRAG